MKNKIKELPLLAIKSSAWFISIPGKTKKEN